MPRQMPRKKQKQNIVPQAGIFTSNLSIDEFLLLDEADFEPVGLVIGSSFYHIGFQLANWSQNEEMTILTQVMYDARARAMNRMRKEANVLEADGIVGVRLEVNRHEGKEALAEFVAIGTAIRARDQEAFHGTGGRFFLSDLSAQDFWTLRRAGYWPKGVVMGNCVYHIAHLNPRQWLNQVGRNMEMANYTTAFYDARELAMQRMQTEASKMGAEGVVGMHIHEHSHGWGAHVMEFFAIGTAISSVSTDHQIPTPSLSLLLNNEQANRNDLLPQKHSK